MTTLHRAKAVCSNSKLQEGELKHLQEDLLSVNIQSGPLIEYYKNKKIEEKTEEIKTRTTPAKQERNVT